MFILKNNRNIILKNKNNLNRKNFNTLSQLLLDLPSHLPFQPSYTTTIVSVSLFFRFSITLPLSIWQRNRTYRLQHVVKPQLDIWAIDNKDVCRRNCKQKGYSYEQYTKEWSKLYKSKRKELGKINNCSILPTILLPSSINIPIFIIMSNTIRVASQLPLEQSKGLILESFFHYPSLALTATDPTLALAIGASFLISTEVNANLRKTLLKIRSPISTNNVDNDNRDTSQTPQENNVRMDESVHEKGITILLRSLSLGMSYFALNIPVSLAIYWLTAGVFSVLQTSFLGLKSNNEARNHIKNSFEHLRDIKVAEFRRKEERMKYSKLRKAT